MIPAVERGRHGAEHGVALGERRSGAVALRTQAQAAPLRDDQQHGTGEDENRQDCAQRAERGQRAVAAGKGRARRQQDCPGDAEPDSHAHG